MTNTTPENSFAITEPVVPARHPSVRALEPLVGNWLLKGHLTGSDKENISGRTTFSWLPGGFFLQQDATINFLGNAIQSREIIGYNSQTQSLESLVYSNLSPEPWPYRWAVEGGRLSIDVKYGLLDATFNGSLDDFSGRWTPNPGADPAANIAYEIVSERADD